MKVSYLITCSTETTTLDKLFDAVIPTACKDDEIIILEDSSVDNPATEDSIMRLFDVANSTWIKHPLNNDYGSHKNYGIQACSGDFIFQLDGDECPPEALLGENLHALLESNPQIEAYAVPRMNDFKGVTEAHAKQWGWRLSYNARPSLNDKTMGPLVNWPDYQWRIFKRDFPRISFTRRLHEKIEGYGASVALPADQDWALYHDKTIEKQIETNVRYNKLFTQAENQGHNVFNK